MFANFEFKYPGNSVYLILALAALVFFILGFRKKERILAVVLPGYKIQFKLLRCALLGLGLGLLVFALLGPQQFTGLIQGGKTGLNLYVLMDTSKSMLVSDVEPDRISLAKQIVEKLLDQLEGDRIGFIPFASGAYIQMPLTDDYQLARMYLRVMDTEMIAEGGTNLAAAISLAYTSFSNTDDSDRVILILSDGEEYQAGASQALLQNLATYGERLKVFTVGLGTETGGPVPVYDETGTRVSEYLQDENGNPVSSRLQAETLKELARDGGGAYFHASSLAVGLRTDLSPLLDQLAALQRNSLGAARFKHFKPLYQYFLAAGALLILLAWFLPQRRIAG